MAVIQCMCPKAFVFTCPTGYMAPLIFLNAQNRIELQATECANSIAAILSYSTIFIFKLNDGISNSFGIVDEIMKARS